MRRRRREGRGRRREEKKGWETEKGGKRGLWATASWGSHGQVHLPHRQGLAQALVILGRCWCLERRTEGGKEERTLCWRKVARRPVSY